MHTIMSLQKSVEVFKTNVNESAHARQLVALLQQHFPGSRINFDLDDCDKVLRVEGHNLLAGKVMALMQEKGFHCRILE
ncbi:hypothetical protein SAMN04488109_6378 [Chryseolinea serpens]|uniref:HMA domain-containing protein n=1 Tax=Chryseolinea serpens TaxID=947013 RepID=A0A1M5XC49_9BACT|nr:hypothetical protein [Chryseolinea serpens]SHH97356.1 hypothetical protein SAMN04488109_6378 [Chryseolinea serpens]